MQVDKGGSKGEKRKFTWHDLDASKTPFRLKRNTAPNDKSPTRQDVL